MSHAEILCKGLSEYSSICEEVTYQTIKYGQEVDIDGLKLCPELILDYTIPYYAGVNILISDLKSTNRSGKITFAIPKTLLSWARQASKDFCCADAYCSRWWDPSSNSPKKSGDTEHDVCKKILQAMWFYEKKISPNADSDDKVNNNCKEIMNVATSKSTTDGNIAYNVSVSVESNNDQSKAKDQKEEYLPPVDWAWKGYLVWYLHGCMAPKSKHLAIFNPDGKPKQKLNLEQNKELKISKLLQNKGKKREVYMH